jgi:outer membrane autotransporter protein
LLSIPHNPKALTKPIIEDAAHRFLALGVGAEAVHAEKASVIIRSAELGAYLATHGANGVYTGRWVQAYWTKDDTHKVVDVTGAGNSFLGGLAAGLYQSGGDLVEG